MTFENISYCQPTRDTFPLIPIMSQACKIKTLTTDLYSVQNCRWGVSAGFTECGGTVKHINDFPISDQKIVEIKTLRPAAVMEAVTGEYLIFHKKAVHEPICHMSLYPADRFLLAQ